MALLFAPLKVPVKYRASPAAHLSVAVKVLACGNFGFAVSLILKLSVERTSEVLLILTESPNVAGPLYT